MLQSFGVLRNPLMDEILMGKFSVQIGDAAGNAPTESSENQIAVILLASRSNQCVIPSELFLYTCPLFSDFGNFVAISADMASP